MVPSGQQLLIPPDRHCHLHFFLYHPVDQRSPQDFVTGRDLTKSRNLGSCYYGAVPTMETNLPKVSIVLK